MIAEAAAVAAGQQQWTVITGACREVMPELPPCDHVIMDPPYSEHVHTTARTLHRGLPDGGKRTVDLGFSHLDPADQTTMAEWCGENVDRWVLAFSDAESAHTWMDAFGAAGLDQVRVGAWIRVGGAPQFSGDRPAAGFEAISIAHRKGRKRWHGGGKAGVWSCPIVANRTGARNSRIHTTQKPLPLMLDLVRDFTDPGDHVVDLTCGSGTTGVACLRLGRRFTGVERDPAIAALARERLAAESAGLTLQDARAGQTSLFSLADQGVAS